jgi:hypothetical protein
VRRAGIERMNLHPASQSLATAGEIGGEYKNTTNFREKINPPKVGLHRQTMSCGSKPSPSPTSNSNRFHRPAGGMKVL